MKTKRKQKRCLTHLGHLSIINPLPDSSKLKEFADDNFKFDENGRKLSKQVEKIVEKEKLLVTSNFSCTNSVFKRLVSQERQKVLLCGNGLNHSFMILQMISDIS